MRAASRFRRFGLLAILCALALVAPAGSSADPPEFEPRQKACVDGRQTEDPLSPVCNAFHDGENGGATWVGVTEDEIRVVLYNDVGIAGDMTTPWKPSDEHGNQADWYYRDLVRTVKAQLRFFQRHFQTFGRRVHVIAFPSGGGPATRGVQRQGEAISIIQQLDPFAAVTLVENGQYFAPILAGAGRMTFGMNYDIPRAVFRENAPYIWSFAPDQQTEAQWSAGLICRSLLGRTARFARDPSLRDSPRSFGLIHHSEGQQRGPQYAQMAAALQRQVKKMCGMEFDQVVVLESGPASLPAAVMARFKLEEITTVVCYCVPQINELTVPQMQAVATAIGYGPEWYWDHASRMDRHEWQRQYGNPVQSSFGVSYLWRQPARAEQYAYQAFASEEPGMRPNGRVNFEIYHAFLHLFTAIQNAGAFITPEAVRDGLKDFARRDLEDPWLPSGGYDAGAPGRKTFIDTAMAWWWDPQGVPPGGRPGEGCLRLAHEGRRFHWSQWPSGDADLFGADAPCSGPIWEYP